MLGTRVRSVSSAYIPPTPQDLGENHQVLAYGYTDTAATSTLRLYDCNHPDDDGVTITFVRNPPSADSGFMSACNDTCAFSA